jgi:hypothetical protein
MTRGELLDKLGMKGDKSDEMSVSNALTALTTEQHSSDRHWHPGYDDAGVSLSSEPVDFLGSSGSA